MIGLAFSVLFSVAALSGSQDGQAASTPSGATTVTASGAATSGKPADTPAPATPATKPKEAKKICRASDLTGSRLRRVQICRTAEEWARVDEQAQRASRALLDPARGAKPTT